MKSLSLFSLILLLSFSFSCDEGFDTLNDNPNQPTDVGPEALLPGAIRSGVNASVNMSYLLGNNIAQLSAKTLRKEVDLYLWNSFNNFVWDPLYESLRDVEGIISLGEAQNNDGYKAVGMILKAWTYSILTDAYGDIPYSEAIAADDDILFPVYDSQESIYLGENGLLATLEEASSLLQSNSQQISGDILFGGDLVKWQRLANALQARLWLRVYDKTPNEAASNLSRLASSNLMQDANDSAMLNYLETAPNQFPTIPLKSGDFDAVNISARLVDSLTNWNDPRLEEYARPANAEAIFAAPSTPAIYRGLENGGVGGGSRLGYRYYNYIGHPTANFQAKGIIMTHAEQELIFAEAAQRGIIGGSAEDYYNSGVLSSMIQYGVADQFPYESVSGQVLNSPADYLAQPSVSFAVAADKWDRIASQKWVALFFTGLEPWFDWRRTGRPAMDASLNNENNDVVPFRFRYPGDEQILNTENYNEAAARYDNGDSINSTMWLLQN